MQVNNKLDLVIQKIDAPALDTEALKQDVDVLTKENVELKKELEHLKNVFSSFAASVSKAAPSPSQEIRRGPGRPPLNSPSGRGRGRGKKAGM